ncbi:MAG: tyrosine-type recombinase/integrase [Clostridia bacterium]
MDNYNESRFLESETIRIYLTYLREQERAEQTMQKYARDLFALAAFLPDKRLTKDALISWKEHLAAHYAATSVNTMLASLNGLLAFMGWHDLKVKPLKIQRQIFCSADKELTRAEYLRLVETAKEKGNERLSLILQTICATGIRVSELKWITAEAVRCGHAQVACKGKRRIVFLPERLRQILKNYLKAQKRTVGAVFVTKTGKPIDRSNIWRDMKVLCESANVAPGKVFPYNLRHLFARTYYSLEKDLSRLADILGHSNVTTTCIYTMESGDIHVKQLGRMGLITT